MPRGNDVCSSAKVFVSTPAAASHLLRFNGGQREGELNHR
jgi:hypothetical protein